MRDATITRSEFERRITALCLGGVGPGLPRKRRDRHILLKAAALLLGHGEAYVESALNNALELWLVALGDSVRLDHVSLRRYLIDEGYVSRDSAGQMYRVCLPHECPTPFEAGVDEVDTVVVVRAAEAERQERRSHRES